MAKRFEPKVYAPVERLEGLTPHQWRIAKQIRQGGARKEIAKRLNISDSALSAHVTNIGRIWKVKGMLQIAFKVIDFDGEKKP